MKRDIRFIAGSVLLAFAALADSQAVAANPGQTRVATRIATAFTPVAGSPENASALVNALRNGTPVTLLAAPEGGSGDPVATSFTPPTRPMGWGNVSHSLSLAQDSLTRLGITNPTNAELQAALMGGEVTRADRSTVALRGILQMRADGMGWGQIAKASGTTMGAVVSSTKAMRGSVPASAGATSTAKSSRGITTAAGSSPSAGKASKAVTTAAASTQASRGLVTAEGATATHGRSGSVTTAASGSVGGNAYGRGVVTASGGSAGAGVAAAAGPGRGAGLVSATGSSVSSSASITRANGQGQGRGQGNGKGKGG